MASVEAVLRGGRACALERVGPWQTESLRGSLGDQRRLVVAALPAAGLVHRDVDQDGPAGTDCSPASGNGVAEGATNRRSPAYLSWCSARRVVAVNGEHHSSWSRGWGGPSARPMGVPPGRLDARADAGEASPTDRVPFATAPGAHRWQGEVQQARGCAGHGSHRPPVLPSRVRPAPQRAHRATLRALDDPAVPRSLFRCDELVADGPDRRVVGSLGRLTHCEIASICGQSIRIPLRGGTLPLRSA